MVAGAMLALLQACAPEGGTQPAPASADPFPSLVAAATPGRMPAMNNPHRRHYDFTQPLDDAWELICDPGWTCDVQPHCAHFVSTLASPDKSADVFLRPCCIHGDTIELGLAPGAARRGVLVLELLAGFEFITAEINLTTGELVIHTHESHKPQPRLKTTVATGFTTARLIRRRDKLPGLPYEGVAVTLVLDGQAAVEVAQIDFLPECLVRFALKGPGEMSVSHLTIAGPARPRPEYVHLGLWQQRIKPTTAQNVDGLIEGVRQAAEAGVQILVAPETSLTGLRPNDPELSDERSIQAELARLQRAVAGVRNAPYTLVGYPDWISGRQVEGATVDRVRVNAHRFVRPDGGLGPGMAKVHVCEPGFWHGRGYNCQRVAGVEIALGICHDARYADVWTTGVMAGARLCLHPAAGGNLAGQIPDIVKGYAGLGTQFDAYWATVNAGGGGAIVYPDANRKHPQTVLAVTGDLTEANPTYPTYSAVADSLGHARIRLWDPTGCYPMRTLRSGRNAYRHWSALAPPVVDVG